MRNTILILMAVIMAAPAGAGILDLTSAGSSGSFGSATFYTTDIQPTGTGILMPFLRIQRNNQEEGFNTDASVGSGDLKDVKGGSWTHSVQVGTMVPVMHNGELSYRFVLDINQASSKSLLSLDELRLFTAASPSISSLSVLNAQNLVYDMGAGNKIYLDYNLGSGSGSGDMYMLIPASLFAGLGNQYLYLYCKMGATGGKYRSNDGFEEWSLVDQPIPVQEATWGGIKRLFAAP